MKIVHLSDPHIFVQPKISKVINKRFFGLLNLYVGRRKRLFAIDVFERSLEDVAKEKPDLVLITGDFTALGLEDEFKVAHKLISQYLEGTRVLAVPGNHDFYTMEAYRNRFIERYLGRYLGGWEDRDGDRTSVLYPWLFRFDNLTILGLNPCHPTIFSTGIIPESELNSLTTILEKISDDPFLIILCHFPIFGADGRFYDVVTRRLINARRLWRAIENRNISLFLHGHIHMPYSVMKGCKGGWTRFFDAGSCGLVQRGKRSATFIVYDIERGKLKDHYLKKLDKNVFVTLPHYP